MNVFYHLHDAVLFHLEGELLNLATASIPRVNFAEKLAPLQLDDEVVELLVSQNNDNDNDSSLACSFDSIGVCRSFRCRMSRFPAKSSTSLLSTGAQPPISCALTVSLFLAGNLLRRCKKVSDSRSR